MEYRAQWDALIALALQEDVGSGDVATRALIRPESMITARWVAKAEGVLSGLEVALRVFQTLDSRITMESAFGAGERVKAGDTVATFRGDYQALLTGERTALNFVQRMSGIATATRAFVDAIGDLPTRLLDTRKTLPGHRILDKQAVRNGGGTNHRMGLYDLAMIKDNHIVAAGGIAAAVKAVRAAIPAYLRVEVETSSLAEVAEALEARADIIMLDNMSLEMMREAVELIAHRALTEASGNVTVERVRAIAETGVDFISTGAITHSVKALDISMKF
ncbi:MAG: carboxylating nicotinate-nucleotide diphosphorylase [Bacteroides sp.]